MAFSTISHSGFILVGISCFTFLSLKATSFYLIVYVFMLFESLVEIKNKNLITTDMASSLVNDNVTVNDLIKKLIQVAELLYSEKDVILETVINNKIQQ